jgi:transposase-like protein
VAGARSESTPISGLRLCPADERVVGPAQSLPVDGAFGPAVDTAQQPGQAFDRFIATYEAKYPKATRCLAADREVLLAIYDFPAAHWQHLRTSNPIESTFAPIRLRTTKTRNCLGARSAVAMVRQLAMSAQIRWRR